MARENSLLHQQIMLLSGQLAPIMDRVGRIYTDFSPHLINNVNSYNNSINNRERNSSRRALRQRTYNPRGRERIRSEDSSESSDDSLSRRGSNSSEHSEPRAEREGEEQDSNEIRDRLRSISSTISRIRSSISSMRSLIFNNLPNGEGTQNGDESVISEREERKVTVNVQVPIISSPGDIASIHNRLNRFISGLSVDPSTLDRFLDRQATNSLGDEPSVNNSNNRNSQVPNTNESGNSSNEELRNNLAETRISPPNTESDDHHHHTHDHLMNLLGVNDRGAMGILGGRAGFGLLGNSLGDIGSEVEGIEFHIHALMPGGEGQENQIMSSNPLNPLNVVNRNPIPPMPPAPVPSLPSLQIRREESRNQNLNTEIRDPVQFTDVGVQTESLRIRRERRNRMARNREDPNNEDENGEAIGRNTMMPNINRPFGNPNNFR